MRTLLLAAALIALPIASLEAAKFGMYLTAAKEQSSLMQNGIKVIDSNLSASSIRIYEPEFQFGKRVQIKVAVFNASDAPFDFGPENISVSLPDGAAAVVIPYERLVQEERNRQAWAAVAAGLQAASNSMNAAQAGHSAGTATYSGSSFGQFGGSNFNSRSYGTATYSGYDAGAALAARSIADAQNRARFAELAEQNAEAINALAVNMRTTTVLPGHTFGGIVTFELPKSARKAKSPQVLTFLVRAGAEEHPFSARIERQ